MYWRQVLAQTTQPKLSGADADLVQSLGKDLAVGIPGLMTQSLSGWEPKKLWKPVEGGRGRYEECAFAEGFDSRADGRSLVAADLDGDGAQELLMLNRDAPKLQLFSNVGEGGNALELGLVPKSGNREAEGARVRTAGGVFPVVLARGYASSVEPRVHVGLGKDAQADVEVQWRSGAREQFRGLKAGGTHWLKEGTGKAERVVPFIARAKRPARPFPSTLAALGLETHEGVTVVQLFLQGCKPCEEEAPALNRLAKSGRVRVVGLGLHPEGEALRAAAKSLKLEYPVKALKDEVADGLSTAGALPLPILLVFSRDGSLVRVLPGQKGLEGVLGELGVPAR